MPDFRFPPAGLRLEVTGLGYTTLRDPDCGLKIEAAAQA